MPKAGIHPTYYPKAVVTCSCGATYEIGSTKENIKLDICRECHPFYTGNQKLIDTAGRVDRFREKMARATQGKMTVSRPSDARHPEETAVDEGTKTTKSEVAEPVQEQKAEEVIEAETPAEVAEETLTDEVKETE